MGSACISANAVVPVSSKTSVGMDGAETKHRKPANASLHVDQVKHVIKKRRLPFPIAALNGLSLHQCEGSGAGEQRDECGYGWRKDETS